MEAPPPALTTVRGFHGTPVTSGDEDSDCGGASSRRTTGHSHKKQLPVLDDVVSANCSPVLRPTGSPAMSGITKLRMQLEPLSLDTSAASSRASSPSMTPNRPIDIPGRKSNKANHASHLQFAPPPFPMPKTSRTKKQQPRFNANGTPCPHNNNTCSSDDTAGGSSRSTSHDGVFDGISSNTSGDETGPDVGVAETRGRDTTTRYVINLENDFVSESVREGVRWTIEDGAVDRADDIFDSPEVADVPESEPEPKNEPKPEPEVQVQAQVQADPTVVDKDGAAAGENGTGVDVGAVDDATKGGASGSSSSKKKITADDFAPLRCLGKGSYGTVLLVKQNSTGRLYAQKQFKKASLVVHKKLVEQTKTERQILESVSRHPFVVKLYYAFQDREKLYLILEYGQGGELFTHLSAERMFSEPTAAFYMAEMALALSHLHDTLGVVYRDLKPENCLLDAEGHLLLTDFGLSKVALPGSGAGAESGATDEACCHSMLGTVEYMAPEVVQGQRYGRAVDWWSFGALGYDLLTGNPPFRGRNNAKIQDNIVRQKLVLPYFLTPDAKDLLTRLLQKNPRKRLGANMPRDLATLKAHRFFRRIDWTALAARQLEPPIQPVITDPELAENFAPEFTDLPLSPVLSPTSADRCISTSIGGGGGVSGGGGGGGVGGVGGSSIGIGSGGSIGTAFVGAPMSAGGGHGRGSFKEDPFGGFSFVASTSLLNESNFPLMA